MFVFDFYFNCIVVQEHTLYDLNHFKFTWIHFMIQNMIYHGKCVHLKILYIQLLLDGVFHKYQLGQVVW